MMGPVRRLVVLLVCVSVLGACGGSGDTACGPVAHEALDPNSGLHALPGEEVPDYGSDTPTSGAHYSLPPPTGAVAEPIDLPLQVTALEGGMVLVQHQGLSDEDVAALEELASGEVIVAPNE